MDPGKNNHNNDKNKKDDYYLSSILSVQIDVVLDIDDVSFSLFKDHYESLSTFEKMGPREVKWLCQGHEVHGGARMQIQER